jgi:Protein of unknown function (DUF1186)
MMTTASLRASAATGVESEDLAWLYALFLLAQFRERRAYPLLVELASLPSFLLESLFGDVLTENLAVLLASVARGDPSGLQLLIEKEGANLFARTAALRAFVIQVKYKEQRREEVLAYLGSLLRGKLKRDPPSSGGLCFRSAWICIRIRSARKWNRPLRMGWTANGCARPRTWRRRWREARTKC